MPFLSLAFSVLTCCLLLSVSADSYPLNCEIADLAPPGRLLKVTCQATLPAGRFQLRFAEKFAGVERLSERVYSLKISAAKGAFIAPEIHGLGLYFFKLGEREQAVTISYELRLARALDPGAYPLTSSLGPEAGFLLLDDLLPRLCVEGENECATKSGHTTLKITPPAGWRVATTELQDGDYFDITDPSRAVFFLAQFRERVLDLNGTKLRVAIAGQWNFTDDQVIRLAEGIAREQATFIGTTGPGDGREDFLVTLAPYPIPLTGLRSSALTRHHTVVMMLNQNDHPARTLMHYTRHLGHEMFHYYLPGAFNVRENFDWFWEGFSRYLSLVTLQKLRLIGLREYLDALSDEYDSYTFNPARNRLSLVTASPDKFANLANYELIYRKGMLVAGLYDLELRWQSDGRQNVTDVIRALYQNRARRGQSVGNREVLAELQHAGKFDSFIRDYIEGTREIDLTAIIKPYGLVIERPSGAVGRVRIAAAQKLSAKQKALLAQFGF